MEGAVIGNGLASSFTHNSPRERRARIARLVGSERAANVELSWFGTYFTTWLISHTAKYIDSRDCVKQRLKKKIQGEIGEIIYLGAPLKASSRLSCLLKGGFDRSQHGFRTRHWFSRQVEVSQPRQGSNQTVVALD
jgi:hypothetical protein